VSERTARLPFAFGTVVYHRARKEKVAGVVTGFIVCPSGTQILIQWGDNVGGESAHHFFELSTEYEPDYTGDT
jgi:hypothetical protein